MVEPAIFGLYSSTWEPIFSSRKQLMGKDIIKFSKKLPKLLDALRCCVCKQLLTTCKGALLPSECRVHFVCKGCLGKERDPDKKCKRCENWSAYRENKALSAMIECNQSFCFLFLTTERVVKVLEDMEPEFDACRLVDMVAEGLKGYPKAKKRKLLSCYSGTSMYRPEGGSAPFADNAGTKSNTYNSKGIEDVLFTFEFSSTSTPTSAESFGTAFIPGLQTESSKTTDSPGEKARTGFKITTPNSLQPWSEPVTSLQLADDNSNRVQTSTSNGSAGLLSFVPQPLPIIRTEPLARTPSKAVRLPAINHTTTKVVDPLTSSVIPVKTKRIRCQCGKSGTVTSGKRILCGGKKCSCYAAGSACSDCKCKKGCQNPHGSRMGGENLPLDVKPNQHVSPEINQPIPSTVTSIGEGSHDSAVPSLNPSPLTKATASSTSLSFQNLPAQAAETPASPSASSNTISQQPSPITILHSTPAQITNPPAPPRLPSMILRWPGGYLQIPSPGSVREKSLSELEKAVKGLRHDHDYFIREELHEEQIPKGKTE